jgi:hypothetical protein
MSLRLLLFRSPGVPAKPDFGFVGWRSPGVPAKPDFDFVGWRSPDVPITPDLATPPPPWVIPDWRRFQRSHPKSSQIGVDFSDFPSVGVGFARIATLCLYPSADHPPPSPYVHPFPPKVTQGTQESAEGRKPLLGASSFLCQRSFNAPHFRSGANFLLYHLFAFVSSKKRFQKTKTRVQGRFWAA